MQANANSNKKRKFNVSLHNNKQFFLPVFLCCLLTEGFYGLSFSLTHSVVDTMN